MYAIGEDDQAAAVCAEAIATDRHEGECGDADPGAPEQSSPDDRRREQHRLEQVVDPVVAPRLRRPERRERHGLGIEPHRDEVRRQDGRAGEAEREHEDGHSGGEREDGAEPQVGGEDDEERPQRERRPRERQADQQHGEPDRQRQVPAVVPLDSPLEGAQRGGRVRVGNDL